jgi:hypothetical protein
LDGNIALEINNLILIEMKKLLILLTALLLVSSVSAQEEGSSGIPNMWLGGELTFGSLSSRDVTIGPHFGILITDQIGVGGILTFSTGNNSNYWALEAYGRYYLPVADQFAFFGDAFILIGGGDNNTTNDTGDFNLFDIGARVGMQYWFTPRWSLAAGTNILLYESTNGDGEFGAGASFNVVNFSFFFHF